jgi:hypothetical protein
MSGKRITDNQYRLYMKHRNEGNTQVAGAAKSGFSERTGRRLERRGGSPSQTRKQRDWRTRSDPFELVWESELVPLLKQSPELQALTLLEHLQKRYSGDYPDSHLRTLQRRVKCWKAQYGPDKEVMFSQDHHPGKLSLSDFTTLKKITVTIKGVPFTHLLYHFRLAFSRWSYMMVVQGGESFVALSQGLQNALWSLGGVTEDHRTDSLSAAFKNLSKEAVLDLTERFAALNVHYGMQATRNNLGQSHENGSVESPHGHLKRRIEQALLLRGSHDFDSVEAYQQFVHQCVRDNNRRNAKLVSVEREYLKPLPKVKTTDYEQVVAKVTTTSTITIKHAIYSVPPKLIGETLTVRIYDGCLVCYLGQAKCIELPRVHTLKKQKRARCIDYRHLANALSKKPQAFRNSVFRDELLPTTVYKNMWQWIDKTLEPRAACKLMVGLLKLAATDNCERQLGEKLEVLLEAKIIPNLLELERQFAGKATGISSNVVAFPVKQHTLSSYDSLLTKQGAISC